MLGIFQLIRSLITTGIQLNFSDDSFSMSIGTYDQSYGSFLGNEDKVILVNVVLLFWTFLGVIYTLCDTIVGLISFTWGIGLYRLVLFFNSFDTDTDSIFFGKMWTIMLCVHFFGWTTQFVGHGCYERRAPAVFTNFLFLFIAPFFVSLEVLYHLFGYRNSEISVYQLDVEADIAFYRQGRGYPMRKGIALDVKNM